MPTLSRLSRRWSVTIIFALALLAILLAVVLRAASLNAPAGSDAAGLLGMARYGFTALLVVETIAGLFVLNRVLGPLSSSVPKGATTRELEKKQRVLAGNPEPLWRRLAWPLAIIACVILGCAGILAAAWIDDAPLPDDPECQADPSACAPRPVTTPLGLALLPALVGVAASGAALWTIHQHVIPRLRPFVRAHDEVDDVPWGEPPPAIQARIAEVEALGFTPLGRMHITPPGVQQGLPIWALISPDRRTAALALSPLWAAGPTLTFVSLFGEDATHLTRFPFGTSVQIPGYRAIVVQGPLPAAYQRHQQEMTRFAADFGEPRLIDSPETLAAHAVRADERHHEVLERAYAAATYAPPAGALLLGLSTVALILAIHVTDASSPYCYVVPVAAVSGVWGIALLVATLRAVRLLPAARPDAGSA